MPVVSNQHLPPYFTFVTRCLAKVPAPHLSHQMLCLLKLMSSSDLDTASPDRMWKLLNPSTNREVQPPPVACLQTTGPLLLLLRSSSPVNSSPQQSQSYNPQSLISQSVHHTCPTSQSIGQFVNPMRLQASIPSTTLSTTATHSSKHHNFVSFLQVFLISHYRLPIGCSCAAQPLLLPWHLTLCLPKPKTIVDTISCFLERLF